MALYENNNAYESITSKNIARAFQKAKQDAQLDESDKFTIQGDYISLYLENLLVYSVGYDMGYHDNEYTTIITYNEKMNVYTFNGIEYELNAFVLTLKQYLYKEYPITTEQ